MLPGDHEIIVVAVITGLLKERPHFSHEKLFAENIQQNFQHNKLKKTVFSCTHGAQFMKGKYLNLLNKLSTWK